MNSNFNFQSFLFISPKKIIISINDELTFEELYKKENIIRNDINEISFEYINKFLDENTLSSRPLNTNRSLSINICLPTNWSSCVNAVAIILLFC